MLTVKGLHVNYDGIQALQGVNIEVPEDKIVTLVGANGAGKSTTLRSIVSLVKKKSGTVSYNDIDITNKSTKGIIELGITLVPEGRRVFSNLTVKENLALGAYYRKDKIGIEKDLSKVYDTFPILKERAWQKAGTLSGGEQQMLAVGRALMSNPKLIMMDEPSLGLAPLLVKEIFNIIKEIKERNVSILLIEQNAKAALEIADYGYVLETGNIVLEGKGQDLIKDDNVRKAYLGEA